MSGEEPPPTDAEIALLVRRLVRQAVHEEMQGKRSTSVSPAAVLLPKDVAQRWGCSDRTVRNMVNDGRLPGLRIGGKLLRIRVEDVEEYERDAERGEVPAAPSSDPVPAVRDPVARLCLAELRRRPKR